MSSGAISLRAEQPEAVLLEQPADAGLQMIVAAAKEPHDLRHQPQHAPDRAGCPERGRITEPMKTMSRQPSVPASRMKRPNWPIQIQ